MARGKREKYRRGAGCEGKIRGRRGGWWP